MPLGIRVDSVTGRMGIYLAVVVGLFRLDEPIRIAVVNDLIGPRISASFLYRHLT